MIKKILIPLLLLCSVTFSQWANEKPILGQQIDWGKAHGLVGFWLMNEDAGNTVQDLSGNGITGSLVNTAQFAAAKYGPGVLLDGDSDYIDFGDPAALELSGDLSYVVMVKPNSISGLRGIMGKIEYSDNTEKDVGISQYNDAFWWQLGSEDPILARLISTTDAVIGQWYQIIGTRQGTVAKLYVNGALEDTDTVTGDINPAHDFVIGSYKSGIGYYFSGVVDYAMVYNRALSAREIAELYANPFGMFEPVFPVSWFGGIGAPPAGGGQFIMISN